MCGILGKITFEGSHEPPDVFDRALGRLDHRGPDDRGVHHATAAGSARISLGQTRLSILDLSQAGHQPMVSPRTKSVIVYNGEVYNFHDVRRELQGKGYSFVSECDTETILAAYDERQEQCVEAFRGMFAIAVYDPGRNRLLLVRDRLGIKPLYYYWDGRQFAFSSEVTALACLPGLKLEVCQTAVGNFLLQGFIPGPNSIFKNVRKLPQGHLLVLDLDKRVPSERRYWDPIDYYASPRTFADENEVLDAMQAELVEAVRRRLISDVPLGAFLSGGIDSSLVVALMRQAHSGSVKTFTIGFSVPEWNEAPAARRIAEHLGTEHEEYYISEENVMETARTVADHYDEPFADESNIPTLLLSRMTRQKVTVVLSGDGGDELFWGYNHYNTRAMRAYGALSRVPRWIRCGMAAGMKRLGAEGLRLGHLLEFEDLPMFYMRPRIWPPGLYQRLHVGENGENRMLRIGRYVASRLPGRDLHLLTGAMDLHAWLVDDILTKVDRATMSVGLEARVPVLDHHVVQLAAAIPSSFKTAGGEQKHLLKALLARFIPRHLWDRPKMGFGIPLVHWLRTSLRDWAYDELGSRQTAIGDWLDCDELRGMLDDHVSGRRNLSGLIWACLQLASWQRRIRGIRGGRHAAVPAGT